MCPFAERLAALYVAGNEQLDVVQRSQAAVDMMVKKLTTLKSDLIHHESERARAEACVAEQQVCEPSTWSLPPP